MLTVIVPADDKVPAEMIAVEVLPLKKKSNVQPVLLPRINVLGVTCVPVSKTSNAALSATVMLPVPVFTP